MKALVNKKLGLKMKLRRINNHISGIGKCPKCNNIPSSYLVSNRGVLVCMACCKDNEEVNGFIVLSGKDHYKYKQAPRL